MKSTCVPVIATIVLGLSAQLVSAQDLSRYRSYVLESSLESVVAGSGGARATDAKTLHERPAKIQELQWRAPYVSTSSALADPVSGAVFSFCNDALYQVVVNYDRNRTSGLTNNDLIESLTAVYGQPVLKTAGTKPPAALADTVVVALWDSTDSSLTLVRDSYSSEFQLVLLSKTLNARAQTAIREAGRLDAVEAPRREAEQQRKEVADAAAARDKLRSANKAAFRP